MGNLEDKQRMRGENFSTIIDSASTCDSPRYPFAYYKWTTATPDAQVSEPLDATNIRTRYNDTMKHTHRHRRHARMLTPEFVERFVAQSQELLDGLNIDGMTLKLDPCLCHIPEGGVNVSFICSCNLKISGHHYFNTHQLPNGLYSVRVLKNYEAPTELDEQTLNTNTNTNTN